MNGKILVRPTLASKNLRKRRVAHVSGADNLAAMNTSSLNYQDMPSPIGRLRLLADGDVLVGIWFEQGRDARKGEANPVERNSPVLVRTRMQLEEYFHGDRRGFDLPLAPRGTEFQRRVWQRLCFIEYGTTTTYGALAQELGNPGAARAVGLANGSNPIPIIIPCHRVIGANGALTGFGGGLPMKSALLELERADRQPRLL